MVLCWERWGKDDGVTDDCGRTWVRTCVGARGSLSPSTMQLLFLPLEGRCTLRRQRAGGAEEVGEGQRPAGTNGDEKAVGATG